MTPTSKDVTPRLKGQKATTTSKRQPAAKKAAATKAPVARKAAATKKATDNVASIEKARAAKKAAKATKTTGSVESPVATGDDLSTPVGEQSTPEAAADRVERLRLAKAEAKALKSWEAAGSKGDRPTTPNLDAVNEQFGNGGAKAAKKSTTKKAGATSTPRSVQTVRFYHDSKAMTDSQNKLASLAFQFTKGVGGKDSKRVDVTTLKGILAKAGIKEPLTTEWEHTLSNGVTLSAKIEK